MTEATITCNYSIGDKVLLTPTIPNNKHAREFVGTVEAIMVLGKQHQIIMYRVSWWEVLNTGSTRHCHDFYEWDLKPYEEDPEEAVDPRPSADIQRS